MLPQNLPEPWRVDTITVKNSIWHKPKNSKEILVFLCGAGGNGGAGQSGVAGTKRAGGGGGSGGQRLVSFAPSIFWDNVFELQVAQNNTETTFLNFTSIRYGLVTNSGNNGSSGSGGVGGAGGADPGSSTIFGQNWNPYIMAANSGQVLGGGIGPGSSGGYPVGDPTNPAGGITLSMATGAGGGGITDTYLTYQTEGGWIIVNTGLNPPIGNTNDASYPQFNIPWGIDGANGNDGVTSLNYRNTAMVYSVGGAGGNPSVSGTGGRGGNGGVGAGGGGGGAGVTGGAGGSGGPGIIIIASW